MLDTLQAYGQRGTEWLTVLIPTQTQFANLALAPDLSNDEWQLKVKSKLDATRAITAEIANYTGVPPQATAVHNRFRQLAGHIDKAAIFLQAALDQHDLQGLDRALAEIKKAEKSTQSMNAEFARLLGRQQG